jgi:hypothetical protein
LFKNRKSLAEVSIKQNAKQQEVKIKIDKIMQQQKLLDSQRKEDAKSEKIIAVKKRFEDQQKIGKIVRDEIFSKNWVKFALNEGTFQNPPKKEESCFDVHFDVTSLSSNFSQFTDNVINK